MTEEYDAEQWFVVLEGTNPGAPTTSSGRPVDLSAEELPPDLVEEIYDENVVLLSAPVDLSHEALDTLVSRTPVSRAFDQTGLLYGHRLLVLSDGLWEQGEVTVELRPDRTLNIIEPMSEDGLSSP